MDIKRKNMWMTRTAVFIALLIVLQMATAPLGNIIVTGTVVNMLLIVSVMTCGLASGLTVAVFSPIMAKMLGIGPLWMLIPFIVAGNVVLVLLWHVTGNRNMRHPYAAYTTALISAAAAKFGVLYIGIVQIALPIFTHLPKQQAEAISHMFSLPQLVTALAGGALAAVLIPRLKRAVSGGDD